MLTDHTRILGSLDSEGRSEPRETSVAITRLQYLLPAVIRVLKRFRVRQKASGFFDFGMTRDQETLKVMIFFGHQLASQSELILSG